MDGHLHERKRSTHHPIIQGLSEGTGLPTGYTVPFTTQVESGTQVTLGQHSPGIVSVTALVPF